MISLCCFSKNRPMQLDAMLKSLENAPYITDISVLYTYDDPQFEKGYNILKHEHNGVHFIKETNFCEQILEIVPTFNEYFTWATDDSVFFEKVDLSADKIKWVFEDKGALALNLRMGLNIVWQNHWHSERSQPIEVMDSQDGIVVWDALKYSVNTDVGRVWQNDASIMPRDKYLYHLRKDDSWKVNKSRSMDGLANCGRVYDPCLMAAFEHSVYLNVPVNLVHVLDDGRLYADNWGKFHRLDVAYLNELFLQGKRINWEKIAPFVIDCGRAEVNYEFV